MAENEVHNLDDYRAQISRSINAFVVLKAELTSKVDAEISALNRDREGSVDMVAANSALRAEIKELRKELLAARAQLAVHRADVEFETDFDIVREDP